jgi:hypothetical protein
MGENEAFSSASLSRYRYHRRTSLGESCRHNPLRDRLAVGRRRSVEHVGPMAGNSCQRRLLLGRYRPRWFELAP